MTASDHNHSIAGSWMGQYFYDYDEGSVAFEIVFLDSDSRIKGRSLDDSDLGEAMVWGRFTYPDLRFAKLYITVQVDPVEYHGTMNEAGTVIWGRWRAIPITKESDCKMGTWIATRGDDGEEFTFNIDQTKDEINDEEK